MYQLQISHSHIEIFERPGEHDVCAPVSCSTIIYFFPCLRLQRPHFLILIHCTRMHIHSRMYKKSSLFDSVIFIYFFIFEYIKSNNKNHIDM